MEISGIILSGGKSSRFGTDKGLVTFNGRALIEYSLELSQQFTNDIIISSNKEEYQKFGFPIIPDIYKEAGPMGGIHASLKETSQNINLILPCDTPYIDASLIHLLLDNYDGEEVIIFQTADHKYHPLLGLYHKSIHSKLEDSLERGHYKLIDFIFNLQHKIIAISKGHPSEKNFLNFNYAEDLKAYNK